MCEDFEMGGNDLTAADIQSGWADIEQEAAMDAASLDDAFTAQTEVPYAGEELHDPIPNEFIPDESLMSDYAELEDSNDDVETISNESDLQELHDGDVIYIDHSEVANKTADLIPSDIQDGWADIEQQATIDAASLDDKFTEQTNGPYEIEALYDAFDASLEETASDVADDF